MADIPFNQPGLAGGVDTEEFKNYEFLLSNSPPLITQEVVMVGAAAETVFKLGSVVKMNTTGQISGLADNVLGTHADGAVGVLAGEFKQPASGTIKVSLYIQGHFNVDALVWDSAFDDDTKKLNAFNGTLQALNGALTLPYRNIRVGTNAYHRK